MTAEEWLGITPTEDKPASIGLKVYNKKYRKFNESFEHFARRLSLIHICKFHRIRNEIKTPAVGDIGNIVYVYCFCCIAAD